MNDYTNDQNAQREPAQAGTTWEGGDAAAKAAAGRSFKEEFRVSGEAVLAKIKELVREGNVRRITIKNDEGRTLIEIPLTIGVIGTVLLPVWAAIGAIAALAANLTIAVEREDAAKRVTAAPAGQEGAGGQTPPVTRAD